MKNYLTTMLHGLNSEEICAVMTCRWRKQEARGGNAQELVLTPDYTQCTTLAKTSYFMPHCIWEELDANSSSTRQQDSVLVGTERLCKTNCKETELQTGDGGWSTFFQLRQCQVWKQIHFVLIESGRGF